MFGRFYFDRQGNPIDALEWSEMLNNRNYATVKQETLPNGTFISTVWMGINHNILGGKPLIFETMVFFEDRTILVGRWSDEVEALALHNRTVMYYSNRKEGTGN